MFSLALLFFTLCLSALVVQIGSIALELTGVPAEKARFQALSAFTGVGYTTRESEAILAHPQRRRVISILIRLGSAGIVTSIGTLAGTLIATPRIIESLVSKDYLAFLPLNAAQCLLIALTVSLASANALLRRSEIRRLIRELIAAWLLTERFVTESSHEEILVTPDDQAVVRLEVSADSLLDGKTLEQLCLHQGGIIVLSVQRVREYINLPASNLRLREGDSLLLYGDLEAIRRTCAPQLYLAHNARKSVSRGDQPLPILTKAPDFELPDQHGRAFRLSARCREQVIILLFYPKDKSFYCSRMLQSYSRLRGDLHELGLEVAAVNPASIKSHRRFCEALGSAMPILSDSEKRVCRAFRSLMLGGLLVNRSVYIINRQQVITYAKRGMPPLSEVIAAARRSAESSIAVASGRELQLPSAAAARHAN